ncbi:MAG TPA: glycerophosphodiester phosphodiesterase [Gaiellaceae bacterium]|nr:glycerophosphodiester phosphodiesterase [Gaiellaceae bacterium]
MLVFAHRGACWEIPENTLAAFRRAIELGADYVEFDVQANRDGELVVVHDPCRRDRADLEADVPTLDEVIEECKGRIGFAVEIKRPDLYRRHTLTRRILDRIAAHDFDPESVFVLSFSARAIAEVRAIRPDLRTIQHVEYVPIRRAAELGARGVGFKDELATTRGIRLAQSLGLETTVYTVNEPARMRKLAGLGVTGIFSDRLDLLRETLEAPRPDRARARSRRETERSILVRLRRSESS